jgi:hypothetical protein
MGGLHALGFSDFHIIRREAERGFIIDADARRQPVETCLVVMRDSKTTKRTKIAAVRALAALDAINLRDIHHVERMQHEAGILDLRMRRAEEGKPNDCVAVKQLAPFVELPLPDDLKHMRRRLLDKPSEN